MINTYYYTEGNIQKKAYEVQVSFNDPSGKRIQRKTKFLDPESQKRILTESAAKKFEAEFRFQMIQEAKSKLEDLTFSEFHQMFLAERKQSLKLSTMSQYDGDLLKWLPSDFLTKRIRGIRPEDLSEIIFEWLPKVCPKVSAHKQKKVLKTLKTIFRDAAEKGYINRVPVTGGLKIKVPATQEKVLNMEEVAILLEHSRKTNNPFYYPWALAVHTGMRAGELYALRWNDIDLVNKVITVSRQWTNKDGYHETKTNIIRVLPISTHLLSVLLELKELGPYSEVLKGLNGSEVRVDDLVLPRLKEWKYGQASTHTREVCRQLGIQEVKFKDLRATFITSLLIRGQSVANVMALAGHLKLDTTQRYVRLAAVQLRGATDMLDYKIRSDRDLQEPLYLSDFRKVNSSKATSALPRQAEYQ